ncbi:unnamed protein product [Symbiodinium sp. CCMP2592]|nr:unnamed protein product [Symbiodinium sp. CCMP2592]
MYLPLVLCAGNPRSERYGPPKHWLCSVLVPSSAHLAWLCFIDFQDLIQQHLNKPAQLPRWLVKHLEFDVLIAHALLDGAAIYSQVLTAEVASELREYHAGLLCATSVDEVGEAAELQVPATFKLPALSLLQVTNQVSPFVNFLTSHTIQRQEQIELFSASKSLSKAAVQQLYDLCRSQPLLGRCICLSLSPPAPGAAQGCTCCTLYSTCTNLFVMPVLDQGCAAALPTARRIQQMHPGQAQANSNFHSCLHNQFYLALFFKVSGPNCRCVRLPAKATLLCCM